MLLKPVVIKNTKAEFLQNLPLSFSQDLLPSFKNILFTRLDYVGHA